MKNSVPGVSRDHMMKTFEYQFIIHYFFYSISNFSKTIWKPFLKTLQNVFSLWWSNVKTIWNHKKNNYKEIFQYVLSLLILSLSIMGFLTILLMNKLNIWLKMLANKINTVPLHPVNKHLSNFFLLQPNALQL